MGVAGQENPAPQVLERGMLDNTLHQPLAQAAAAMRFQHKNVAEVSHGGEIADDASKTYLRAAVFVNAEAQRMLDRTRDNVSRNAPGPIAIGKKAVNHIQIDALTIGADQKLAAPVLHNCWVTNCWVTAVDAGAFHSNILTCRPCLQLQAAEPVVHICFYFRHLAFLRLCRERISQKSCLQRGLETYFFS